MAFVLHSAGSVHPERWHYITQFVVDVVEQLDVGLNRIRVAVITWSDAAQVAFTLDRFTTRQDVVQVMNLRSKICETVKRVSLPPLLTINLASRSKINVYKKCQTMFR